jgi:hypothetical protein
LRQLAVDAGQPESVEHQLGAVRDELAGVVRAGPPATKQASPSPHVPPIVKLRRSSSVPLNTLTSSVDPGIPATEAVAEYRRTVGTRGCRLLGDRLG